MSKREMERMRNAFRCGEQEAVCGSLFELKPRLGTPSLPALRRDQSVFGNCDWLTRESRLMVHLQITHDR